MSQATNTKLMDTEPGGEQTQYEGAKVFKDQVSPPNQSDKDASTQSNETTEKTEAELKREQEHRARGEKTAENIRYGEAISEHGFGGETVGNSRGVENGSGKTEQSNDARKIAGYRADGEGDGDGVGA